MKEKLFTSESVTSGHPDKICDRVCDAVLDEIIRNDMNARVACESICTTGLIMLFGEITTDCYVDMAKIARRVINDIGYSRPEFKFDSSSCAVILNIDEQSRDIAAGIFKDEEDRLDSLKAGDQGLFFGFACDETKELMPFPITVAHRLSKRLDFVRREGIVPYFGPDGKTQVTVRYVDEVPVSIDTIVVSIQHLDGISEKKIRDDVIEKVIFPVISSDFITNDTKFVINPSGRFVLGGPAVDSGLTGRKLIVDTYGGYARHGGGAFSGKDPTKVDRTACYFARYVAKNIVAAGLAKKCEVQLSYAIGVSNPVSIYVDTFGTGKVSDYLLKEMIEEIFDFRPAAMIKKLDLLNPIYEGLSNYGHFGREDLGVSFEKVDMADRLIRNFGSRII